MSMRTGELGKALIKEFEGLELMPYLCSAGVVTIGRGHVVKHPRTGAPLRGAAGLAMARELYPQGITEEEADRLFEEEDLPVYEQGVSMLCTRTPTQNEFDALVSFAYNLGLDIDDDTKAEGLGDSTLLRKFNSGDKAGAAAEFVKWNKAGGVVLAGLTRRRNAEAALFTREG